MHRLNRLIVQLFAVSLLAASAHAGVITVYSNFSEDPSAGPRSYPYACSDAQCDNLSAYGIEWHQGMSFEGGSWPAGLQEAMPFTVAGSRDLYLYELQLAMYKWADGTVFDSSGDTIAVNHDNLTIELMSDASGLPSGNVLETLAVNPSVAEDAPHSKAFSASPIHGRPPR
jgi:hypothetical protein